MFAVKQVDTGFPSLHPGMSAADATHEINNLLTVVLCSLEQLQRQALDARGRGQLERAQSAARQANDRLQQLVVLQS